MEQGTLPQKRDPETVWMWRRTLLPDLIPTVAETQECIEHYLGSPAAPRPTAIVSKPTKSKPCEQPCFCHRCRADKSLRRLRRRMDLFLGFT